MDTNTFPARCEDCGEEFAAHLPPQECLCCGPCATIRANSEDAEHIASVTGQPFPTDAEADAMADAYEAAYIDRACERAQEAGR